jgi:hypothetical protein
MVPLLNLIPVKGGGHRDDNLFFRRSKVFHIEKPHGKFLLFLFVPDKIKRFFPEYFIIPFCHEDSP